MIGAAALLAGLRWRPGRPGLALTARLAAAVDPMVALLLHDMDGPALAVDCDGRIVRSNEALAQLLQGSVSLSSGGPAEHVFKPAERVAAWELIRPILQGRASGPVSFASLLQGCEAGHEIRVTAIPLGDVAGGADGALLRFTDLTAQRQLEAQLAHSQKLQATGQLAGGIAHDFNNLLTAILGAAEGIIGREDGVETREDALQVRASAERGAALVRQLLAFGRQQTLQPRSLAVNGVIQDLSGLLQRLLGASVRLVLDLEEPGRMVRADPTQLDQVLINLAVNGRDAMRGGGQLTLRSGHITVFRPLVLGVETIPPGRYVMIEVQDTGCGIPPDVLPRIFDPFFTTKRDHGGSGLGLSTVHGIVRQSDGFLAVDSEVGRGTSMRIYLPRHDGAEAVLIPRLPPAEVVAPPAAADPSAGRVVLLVDDEDPVRRLAARALTRAGWDVMAADSGDEALKLLESRGPHLPPLTALVTDMVMPGMDGMALLRAVRAACGRPKLPAIVVSGYAESPLRGGLDTAGAIFMAKPYRLAELVATLQETVNKAN